MHVAIHEEVGSAPAVRGKGHRSTGLYRGAMVALMFAVLLVAGEVVSQRLFVSGLTIIAILIAAAGFFIAGRRVDAI